MNQQRLQNSFNWSASRESTFLECQKKYWYTYYGSWDGWPIYYKDPRGNTLDPLAAHLYMLKNMQPIAIFIGSIVHSVIETVMKSIAGRSEKKLPELSAILAEGELRFKKGIHESTQGAWKKHPKKHAHLLEHYYHFPLSNDIIDNASKKVTTCLENWYSSPCVQNIALDSRAAWGDIEKAMTFEVQKGINAIVVFDFYLRWHKKNDQESPIIMIFDWKTGQESQKIEEQLYAYALAAQKELKASIDSMILVPFYLAEGPFGYKKIGTGQIETIQREKLQKIEEKIVASSQEMLKLHDVTIDSQGASTKPDPRLFSYTSDMSKCKKCPFRQVCEKASYASLDINELREKILEKEISTL